MSQETAIPPQDQEQQPIEGGGDRRTRRPHPGEDEPSRCHGVGCILIFMGEVFGQSAPALPSGWYSFSDHALEGWSRLCVDLGYELLGAASPSTIASWRPDQP